MKKLITIIILVIGCSNPVKQNCSSALGYCYWAERPLTYQIWPNGTKDTLFISFTDSITKCNCMNIDSLDGYAVTPYWRVQAR